MQIESLLLKVAEFNHMYAYINMCDFGKSVQCPVWPFEYVKRPFVLTIPSLYEQQPVADLYTYTHQHTP